MSQIKTHASVSGNSNSALSVVFEAFRRALVSQMHPKMLAAILLPFAIAIIGAVLMLYIFWSPLTSWLNARLDQFAMVDQLEQWLIAIKLVWLKVHLVSVLAAIMLIPMAGVLGVIIAAVFVMPIVLRHIEKRQYPELKRMGSNVWSLGAWNAVKIGIVFAIGWAVTMPLWFFPPFALVLPIFWWAFLYNRIMRVDALIEHASSVERRAIWSRNNGPYWLIGLIVSLLNLFPPMWLVLPVFSSLVFAHYSLMTLQRYRFEQPGVELITE